MNQVITPETLYPIIQTLCADDYNELLKKMQLNQKIINDAANALHKIIEAMKDYQEVVKLSREIEIDETYFLLNMKGLWKGEPAVLRGVSNEHVCVFIALDENDQVLTKVVGQGNPWKDHIFDAIKGKVKAGSHITSNSKSSYFDIAHQLKCLSYTNSFWQTHQRCIQFRHY